MLDTNHLSPIVTIDHPLRVKILASLGAGDTFAIAAPVLNEFVFGIGSLPRYEKNFREWEYLRPSFSYYDINSSDAEKAALLRLNLRSQGWQLELVDSCIAIIALSNDFVLLTADKDFHAIPSLKLDNWLTA